MVNIFSKEIDSTKYFIVKYFMKGRTNLREAAWNLAIGQSIGNPKNRSVWETEEMFQNHSCFILEEEDVLKSKKEGIVEIAFPLENITPRMKWKQLFRYWLRCMHQKPFQRNQF